MTADALGIVSPDEIEDNTSISRQALIDYFDHKIKLTPKSIGATKSTDATTFE
ncbi:MAG: hypothetical protein IPJ82_05535 [Lewinellaceae bacterium]|nr:hypothetical protein [Lewinellaceae bacterium]